MAVAMVRGLDLGGTKTGVVEGWVFWRKKETIYNTYIYIYNCTYHILHLPIFFKKDIWNNFKKK